MNIEGFRSVAERPNAIVTVDLKSAQVRVRSNNVFNRAITWLRHRFSSAPSRTLATDAARNRFLQAIGDRRSGYDSADVSRARDLLAEDMENQRPLSTRRIREVLEDLDGRSSPTTRIDRRVAVAYSDATGRPATLALRDLVAEAQKERGADTLSLYGDESVASAAPPESGMDGEDGLTRPRIPPSPDSYEPVASAAAPEPRMGEEDETTRPLIRPSLDRYEPVAAALASEPGTDGEDEMTQPLIPPSSTNATVRAAAPEAATASATRRKQLHDSNIFFRRLSSADTVLDTWFGAVLWATLRDPVGLRGTAMSSTVKIRSCRGADRPAARFDPQGDGSLRVAARPARPSDGPARHDRILTSTVRACDAPQGGR